MNYQRFLLSSALILTLCIGVYAQSQDTGKNQPKSSWKVTKEYDRATDRTSLSIGLIPITCVKDDCIFFNLMSSFPGTKPQARVDRFIFGLIIFAKTISPFADSTLFLRVDDKPIEMGPMTFVDKISKDNLEGLAYGIPLGVDELSKIANASKVEMRIGDLKFNLGENHINVISDYYRQVTTLK